MISYRKGFEVPVAKLNFKPRLKPADIAGFFLPAAFLIFLARSAQIPSIITNSLRLR